MSLSDQLKYARKASGITQQEMADGLNVSKSTYSRYESGERKFPSNKLADAAMLLGVSVSSLLGTSDDLLEIKKDPPAEADEPVDVSKVISILAKNGFIEEGQDLSDKDVDFIINILETVRLWFDKQ